MAGAQRSELQDWECWSLLASKQIGRIGILDHEYPIALPVNYLLVGEGPMRRLLLRTAPTTTIGRYSGYASIEVDEIDTLDKRAWSVVVRGHLRHVPDPTGLPDPGPWITHDRTHWMVLDNTTVTGRRFVGRTSDDGYAVEWEIDSK